jgi:adenosylcobinamide-GDP ribazoletransferase
MKRLLVALQFLTIIPFKIKGKVDDNDLGRSLIYFPIAGLLIGLFLAGIAYFSAPIPPLVTSALILIAWVVITGGIHLDGFADTCDGFYGNRPKEDILRIMRDSRVGTMGAVGVALILLFKFAILSSIRPEDLWKVLIIAVVFARWSQTFACATSKYARGEGKAKYFIEYAKKGDIFIGAVFTLLLNWFLIGIRGVILFVIMLAVVSVFIRYAKKKIGGMTGDTVGAANEIAEAASLLFSLILLGYRI